MFILSVGENINLICSSKSRYASQLEDLCNCQ